MTEAEYRAYPAKNYSNLKIIADPIQGLPAYKKKVIDGIKDEDEDNSKYRIGKIADDKLFSPDEFDKKYYLTSGIERPTGKALAFADKFADLRMAKPNGEVMVLAQRAFEYAEIKSPKTLEVYLKDYKDSNLEKYIDECIASHGRELITERELNTAERIVNRLKTNRFTKHLFVVGKDEENLYQLPLVYEYEGHNLKGLLDFVKINHKKKIIRPMDLKCLSLAGDFNYIYYKNFYYLQMAIYNLLIRFWASDKGYGDYEVLPFKFITSDSIDYRDPLIWETSTDLWEKAMNGTVYRGREWMGLSEILQTLEWAEKNDEWRCSPKDFINKGIRQIL